MKDGKKKQYDERRYKTVGICVGTETKDKHADTGLIVKTDVRRRQLVIFCFVFFNHFIYLIDFIFETKGEKRFSVLMDVNVIQQSSWINLNINA